MEPIVNETCNTTTVETTVKQTYECKLQKRTNRTSCTAFRDIQEKVVGTNSISELGAYCGYWSHIHCYHSPARFVLVFGSIIT